MNSGRHWEQDKDSTTYVGNLDERVTDAMVWELMLQAGRIVNVHLPKDRVSMSHQGYGFVEFMSEGDADYAAKIMNGIRLFGKPIRVNKASADKSKTTEVGAELYIGNLDGMVDERVLYETFQQFGTLVGPPKIARDDTNVSKGYGFVSFSTFDASDNAIREMDNQFLMNRPIRVQYAFKKDGKGERHGDEAERKLAEQAKARGVEPTKEALPAYFTAPLMAVPSTAPPAQMPMPVNGIPNGAPPPFMPNGGYPGMAPPPRPQMSQPLPPPPPGLPNRPPSSQAGYGGPAPPGMPGYPPPMPGYPGSPAQQPPFPPPGFPAQYPPPPAAGAAYGRR